MGESSFAFSQPHRTISLYLIHWYKLVPFKNTSTELDPRQTTGLAHEWTVARSLQLVINHSGIDILTDPYMSKFDT
jgi:hypothetical protein